MAESERIVVAMSGGVDSSVVAALLAEAGHDVIGLFMRNGVVAGDAAKKGKQGCCSLDDSMDARRVAALLDVPFFAVNFKREFGKIIDYFVDEYDRGRTPNPCILCNRDLKFGRLIEYADEVGASKIATGHYGRIVEHRGRLSVARAADRQKDQSYVLFPLDQSQLSRTLLPLGNMTKAEVRAEAHRFGLPVGDKPDSQEICFVPDNDYGNLLRQRNPESLKPGRIIDVDGQDIGPHEGHQLYTIGQRKGLGGGFKDPIYVVEIRAAENLVVIGGAEHLAGQGLEMSQLTWGGLAGLKVGEQITGAVKVRSAAEPVPARARLVASGQVEILFDEPIRAVTPGQAAVFYEDDAVLFGGFIDTPLTGALSA
ncbi:MAG: tRNA 2-thiouridine(34) synthase MnmA [Planctomycetota bacterium]